VSLKQPIIACTPKGLIISQMSKKIFCEENSEMR
jgi:hypothetical protein